jgi:signal peptidase
MRPEIQPGDLAITRPVPIDALRVGDVISFYPPGEDVATLHRIASIERPDGRLSVKTKGDANQTEDPWGWIRPHEDQVYRLVAVVPNVGYVPVWTESARGPLLISAGLLLGLSALLRVRHSPDRVRPEGVAEGRSS